MREMFEPHHFTQLLPQLQLGIGQEFLPRMSFSGHCRLYRFNNETEDFTKALLDKPEAKIYHRLP